MARKPSFFERLTGTIHLDDYDTDFDQNGNDTPYEENTYQEEPDETPEYDDHHFSEEGKLSVDVYETPEDIIVKTMCAGVRPEDLEIGITREEVTIEGKRNEDALIDNDDYFARELYWGTFSRAITLPVEVEPEEAEAIEKHGLLIIRLPKIQKDKQTRVKVKSA